MTEEAATTLDPRTAEVLRSLDRAKETIARPDAPTSGASAPNPAYERRALREEPTQATADVEATAQSLASTARVLERLVVLGTERLGDLQRVQDGASRELRDAVHALVRQADVLVAWRSWWTRQIAGWALLLALLFAAGVALAWRAHVLAQNTHDVLNQILENQTKGTGGQRAEAPMIATWAASDGMSGSLLTRTRPSRAARSKCTASAVPGG